MTERAVLVSVNWETEETMHSFIEGPDAISKAQALKLSIEDDWPGWEHRVLGNQAARERNGDNLVRQLFGD